jgi:hypothetical protein
MRVLDLQVSGKGRKALSEDHLGQLGDRDSLPSRALGKFRADLLDHAALLALPTQAGGHLLFLRSLLRLRLDEFIQGTEFYFVAHFPCS